MNRLLPLFLLLLLALGGQRAYASHAQGGQLTYEALGNNRYRVTLRYFRDCSGITAETSHTLNARVGSPVTSCASNDPRNFTATLVRGQLITGSPYCSSVSGANQCSSTSQYPNYEVANYTADITLPAAPEWTLSVEISARPSIENIGGNTTLRYEATLNNQIALSNGTQQAIQNTSPQYQQQDSPMPLVCWNQRTTLTFSTFEPDGDSLVYSLDRPLEGCNQFTTYQPFNVGTNVIINPNAPNCVIQLPTATGTYSPTFPIYSFTVSGSCPVLTATPYFDFNPQQGSITFTPGLYFPNTAPSAGRNKYAVVGKVTEYRKLNGRYYKVGSVRRDMLVIVIDCGGNVVPSPPASTPGGTPGPVTRYDSLVVEGVVGNYTEVNYYFSDPNPADLLTVSMVEPTDPAYLDMHINLSTPARPVVVLGNGTATPSIKVRLRPDPALLGRTFRIPIRIEDNACPVKGTQYYVVVLKAVARTTTAAPGAQQRLTQPAYPNPFSERVSFTLPRPRAGQGGTVLVLDPLGRVVDRLSVPAAPGPDARLSWTPAAQLPAGVYSARFTDANAPAVRLLRVLP
jgi:hypothetical protein